MFPLYQACFIMAFDRTRIVTNLIGNLCLQRQPNNRNQRAIQSRGLKKSIFCTARCNGKAPIHDSKRIQQCRHNSKKKKKKENRKLSKSTKKRNCRERERERLPRHWRAWRSCRVLWWQRPWAPNTNKQETNAKTELWRSERGRAFRGAEEVREERERRERTLPYLFSEKDEVTCWAEDRREGPAVATTTAPS